MPFDTVKRVGKQRPTTFVPFLLTPMALIFLKRYVCAGPARVALLVRGRRVLGL